MPWSVIWDSIWSTFWFSFSITFGWDLDWGNDSSTRFSIQLPWEWVGARRESSFQGSFLATAGSIPLECQFLVISGSSENSKRKDNAGVSSPNAFKSHSIFIVCYLRAFTAPLPLRTCSPEVLPLEGSLLLTPWTVAHQAPLSMEFSREKFWSGLPFSSPGDLPNPGIKHSLLCCRQLLYHLSHQESPMLVWK